MNNHVFAGMAKAMELQQKDGKKDRYIEITQTLLSVDVDALSEEEKLLYCEELAGTLSFMDFQIYELYRGLQDRLAEVKESMKVETDELPQVDLSEMEESLSLKLLHLTARSACFELEGAGLYETEASYTLYVNGEKSEKLTRVVSSIYDLLPSKEYEILVVNEEDYSYGRLVFTTKYESVTIDVRSVGAKGNGINDDTRFLQAAILACPKEGRVLVPAGVYNMTSLFLKSDIAIELAEGAELRAIEDHSLYPVFQGMIPYTDGSDEYNLGSWEGNPLTMYAGVICGIQVSNVDIYGKGVVNGNASKKDWWNEPKKMKDAYRPRLVFLNGCDHITLQGITLKNSPSWTMHPYFSDDLGFYNVEVDNPFDSPNTDGLDPESCQRVVIAGVKFSLGDDCIAVKSGKIYMGKKTKRPSKDITISHCLMQNGHGAVTIGSEMSGGVCNLVVENCVFSDTDRGLRIKTRRGRGKDAILDRIIFRNIEMDHVMTPFVVNTFYFCDPDGKTEYVQSREIYPVDDRTPLVKQLVFEDIQAKNCHVAAAYMEGLPEQKIEEIVMRNVSISYAENPKCDVPAMSEGVEACSKKGIFAKNVKKMIMEKVSVRGQSGEAVILEDVDLLEDK